MVKPPAMLPAMHAEHRGKSALSGRLDLNDIRAFVVVAQCNGYTRAATHLGVARSSLSRRVQRLEWALKVRLIHRDTHAFALTEVGDRFYKRATAGLESVAAACAMVDAVRGAIPDNHFLVPTVGDGQRPPTSDQIRVIIREELKAIVDKVDVR